MQNISHKIFKLIRPQKLQLLKGDKSRDSI